MLHPLRIALLLCDGALTAASLYLAFHLRLPTFPLPAAHFALYLATAGPLVACRLLCLLGLRVYRIAIRYTGTRDLQVLLFGTLLGSLLFTGYLRLYHWQT